MKITIIICRGQLSNIVEFHTLYKQWLVSKNMIWELVHIMHNYSEQDAMGACIWASMYWHVWSFFCVYQGSVSSAVAYILGVGWDVWSGSVELYRTWTGKMAVKFVNQWTWFLLEFSMIVTKKVLQWGSYIYLPVTPTDWWRSSANLVWRDSVVAVCWNEMVVVIDLINSKKHTCTYFECC